MKFQYSGEIRYLTFDIFPGKVIHAVFTRQGGSSPSPWNSLNVGGTVGDKSERVKQNRYRSFESVGCNPQSIFDVWQVHSSDVIVVNSPHAISGPRKEIKADAMITDVPDVSLFMRFADCTPILLFDPVKNAIGIVHAGWQGTVKRIAYQTVKTLQSVYGSNPGDMLAAIGPSIGPDHYEVGPDVIDKVNVAFGKDAKALLVDTNGRQHLDLWSANKLCLEQAGIRKIEVAGLCTACHPEDWFSHRAEKGKTGRFGAIISLKT